MNTLKNMYDRIMSDESSEAYSDYRIKVHAMKNSAAMCGALQVSSLARVLEFAARDIDKTTLVAVMPVFEREWMRLKELLDDAFGAEDKSSGGEAIDRVLFDGYLDSLGKAMEELDMDTADAIMEELAKYGFEPDEQEIVDQLAIAVKNLDSDQAAELIGKLK